MGFFLSWGAGFEDSILWAADWVQSEDHVGTWCGYLIRENPPQHTTH